MNVELIWESNIL